MNENELIDAVAKDSGLARADAAKAVDAVVTRVTKTLKKGEDVAISGFGKFSVIRRGARTGRNPATGAALKIRASKAEVHRRSGAQRDGQWQEEDLTVRRTARWASGYRLAAQVRSREIPRRLGRHLTKEPGW